MGGGATSELHRKKIRRLLKFCLFFLMYSLLGGSCSLLLPKSPNLLCSLLLSIFHPMLRCNNFSCSFNFHFSILPGCSSLILLLDRLGFFLCSLLPFRIFLCAMPFYNILCYSLQNYQLSAPCSFNYIIASSLLLCAK